MLRLLPAVLAISLTVSSAGAGDALAEINSLRPSSSIRISPVRSVFGPKTLDFKKQELPKTIPATPENNTLPNLNLLIDQLLRHGDLNSSATKLMPWVYTTTSESVVADYEEALKRLEFADACLQQAMYNVLCEPGSLGVEPMLVMAATEMDNAEFTIMLLIEIAKLEL